MKNVRFIDGIQPSLPEMIEIRHEIHRYPELGFQEHHTSQLVARKLKSWGYEVVTNIAGTGVVASLRVGDNKKVIGLRADMDALPIQEHASHAYSSQQGGVMHACGHDGHTTTLLAAAKYLAETQNFSGTVRLIFQPAEEGLGGAKRMVEEHVFEKFPCDVIYGYHNVPGLPLGKLCFLSGIATAASDRARIVIKGRSGHGAKPHTAVDPIITGASIVNAFQTIISRNIDPLESGIITIGSFTSGDAYNIIPETAELRLSIRSYTLEVREILEQRIKDIAVQQAQAFGAEVEIEYWHNNPPVINDPSATEFACQVAENLFGKDQIVERKQPFSFSEDFSFMQQACKGCYFFIGNGDSPDLHNDHYDFNDSNLLTGASFWVALVEQYLS
ncbi:M20 aminoacylase family protein [Acinetobacter baumannii]|uniref:M20 aminoacylase family protein n=1 Tax=Acinetobacter baumannii TaxID=470 RepID=UPI0012317D11|nr:M20 aminoacylase family protein [Acinetobacter baumannii]MDI9663090.1 M20 aminoacylase family protein [Acinetobacter baumannii]MDI9709145.1 M20 aminoacylase family protein [Acinetobacter baumannii]